MHGSGSFTLALMSAFPVVLAGNWPVLTLVTVAMPITQGFAQSGRLPTSRGYCALLAGMKLCNVNLLRVTTTCTWRQLLREV
jgi:hypothetical protein